MTDTGWEAAAIRSGRSRHARRSPSGTAPAGGDPAPGERPGPAGRGGGVERGGSGRAPSLRPRRDGAEAAEGRPGGAARPRPAHLDRLRHATLAFAAVNLAAIVALGLVQRSGALLAVGAVLGAALLCVVWTRGRKECLGPLGDVAVAVALLLLALPHAGPAAALGLHASVLGLRAAQPRRVGPVPAAAMQALAYAGAAVLAGGHVEVGALAAVTTWMPALLLLGAGALVDQVVRAFHFHGRTAAAQRALAAAGVRLLDAAGPPAIAVVGLDAAAALLNAHGPGRVALLLLIDGRLQASAAVDAPSEEQGGVPLWELDASLRSGLEQGGQRCAPPAALGLESAFPAADRLRVFPLVSHGVLQGLIAADHGEVCPDGDGCRCVQAMETLAAQVALALESDAIARDARESEHRFRSIVQHSADIIAVIDVETRVRYLSPAMTHVLGHRPGDVATMRLVGLLHEGDLDAWDRFLQACSQDRDPGMLRCRLRHADGFWRDVDVHGVNLLDEPSVAGIVLTIRDVTDRTAREADLTHQALHDALTDLPNRTLLLSHVQEALSDPERRRRMALLFIDLDGFKAVNDRLGHAAGDEVLVEVARRLRATIGSASCVARLSGDEFAVLVEGLAPFQQALEAKAYGDELLTVLEAPCTVQREQVRVRASIGVAVGATGLEDAGDLLHRADLAMYEAKAAGKGLCTVFDLTAHETQAGQLQLQSELRRALDADELDVRYQPLVSLVDGRIVSTEALVRWHHPQRGLLGPATFIPLAEDEGLISEVFALVLKRACRQVRRWQERLGAAAPHVAVNLSPVQLREPGLVEQVVAALEDARVDASCLTLELTENVLLTDPKAAAATMGALKDIGVKLAIDDFGTGYSSLAYLRALPLDVLKIDKTFVSGLGSRDPSGTLARTIIDLGRRLGLRTVAEGVELPQQEAMLREFGCDYGQGYLFARPLIGAKVDEMVLGAAQAGRQVA